MPTFARSFSLTSAASISHCCISECVRTGEEQAARSAELRRLDSRLSAKDWISIEAAIGIEMQQPGFCERPDRFQELARYLVMDRVKPSSKPQEASKDPDGASSRVPPSRSRR
jgi:hypothetical protein